MQKHLSILLVIRPAIGWIPRRSMRLLWALCAMGLFAGVAAAQQPTDAQRSAIKSACRSDFMAQCSGVTPGGSAALQCLQQHNASLSGSCQQAIAAISGGTPAPAASTPAAAAPAPASKAPAAGQPTQAQRNAIKSACRSDFMAQCSGVTPGGQAALSCLQQHSASLSASCQQAVGALGGGAAAAPAAAAPAAPAAPAMQSMPSFTPRQEIFIVRQACGGDFRAYCGAVPLGGGRGIACLRQNLQRLSPSCQRVLTSGL
jgi:hypothetical protein